MRRLIACLMLAAAASMGVAISADDPPEVPEVPPAEPETPAPTVQTTVTVESDEEGRAIKFFVEATAWWTQPVGADYVYATEIFPGSPFSTSTRTLEFGTEDRTRWRAGISLKDDIGAFVFTYWGATVNNPTSVIYPGQFIIGETLVYPLYAGLNNNGLADGVTVNSITSTRDTRLDFVRNAFTTARLSTKWLAGMRFVDHRQSIDASYHALVPNLPPLINENGEVLTGLTPLADHALRESRFSGRGIEAGFEARYEVIPKLYLDGGFVYAILRGSTDASYASVTNLYTQTNPETNEEFLLSPLDYEETFSNPANFGFIQQRSVGIGLRDNGSSTSASVLEANLGFRWQVWRGLEVLGGLRQTRYEDVVLELRPRDPTVTLDGIVNVQAIEKDYGSVAYEGYYLGVAFTF